MSENSADITVFAEASPRVRVVGMDRPWIWLARGWEDLRRAPGPSLGWALLFVAAGLALMGGLAALGLYEAILPLAAGFPLLAPILVVGLYEISHRLERGEAVSFRTPFAAWQRNAGQIGFLGFVLGFFFLAWMRLATLLFAWFFGTTAFTGAEFLNTVVLSGANLLFLVVGTAIGAVLAAGVFAIAAISAPMLLDREVSVFTAIATSVAAVRANPRPMLLWAVLIVLFTGAGLLVAMVGLALTLPLVAHATWHAYRDLVVADASA
ncbi:MAG: DUF2189 domain-containing protein [Rhodospirillaceae bacterium]|nr:DUF2189 domain-containing protein [Rhodospirillaceae bacterium]